MEQEFETARMHFLKVRFSLPSPTWLFKLPIINLNSNCAMQEYCLRLK